MSTCCSDYTGCTFVSEKKMWGLSIILLLATAVFAQQYEDGQYPSNRPMDINDDIYNRDISHKGPPPDRLFFNFEQRRIDQPPQVERRDENLRQYMGRPRTTPVPVPTNFPEVRQSFTTAPPVPYDPSKWGPMASHLPATLPPAPTMPKWMDLSSLGQQALPQQMPSKHRSEYYEPSLPAQQPFRQPMSAEEFVRPKSRGSHKFDWADVTVPAPLPVVSTTTVASVPVQNFNNPPSAFPTLSPWHGDAFGK
ncbi:hypothetical protein evm_009023 [Chilo suppressalis]|nr:hypothetical protein evm_009023 [Chilo suppressalis]